MIIIPYVFKSSISLDRAALDRAVSAFDSFISAVFSADLKICDERFGIMKE